MIVPNTSSKQSRLKKLRHNMSQPLSESDILFPHQSNTPNLSSTLSSLKRSTLSIHNRLTSITSDSEFVASVAEAYQLPLVANERCGSWYIAPEKKTESVYFKSTDGHMGEWGFSLRRLNLQLLDVVQKYGGAVIVDSTRRGKSMPDALSKTIPIWCCVINRAVFGVEGKQELSTPPQAISESEHTQIASRIDGCVRQFIVRTLSLISNLFRWSDHDRKYASLIFRICAQSFKSHFVRYGLHNDPRYQRFPLRLQTSVP